MALFLEIALSKDIIFVYYFSKYYQIVLQSDHTIYTPTSSV
jgi:hypothetical protein